MDPSNSQAFTSTLTYSRVTSILINQDCPALKGEVHIQDGKTDCPDFQFKKISTSLCLVFGM